MSPFASGANPLEVSRRAGHSSTSFTLDRYGHLFPEADQSVADRLELLIADGRKTDEVPIVDDAKPTLTLLPGNSEWTLWDSFQTLPRWRSAETTTEPIPSPRAGPLDLLGHLSSAD